MKRVQGSKGIALIECINHYTNKYRIRWDIQPYFNEEGEEQGVSYYETEVMNKPSMNDVRQIVLKGMNQVIDDKILSEFVWNDMQVWLSSENQFNYKAAYDLAVQSGGGTLPVIFKFGNTDNPVYYEFKTLEDLSGFYLQVMSFINSTLSKGWQKKDNVDWSIYENELK
jgi:hypothetical protein|uniref:Uncharacterized protein n=1 Tax=Myoviridae sp. ctrCp2 TaxID=2825179 RepID=A0A8S5NYW5_9CAUD|nr:MAG TPA: hypothetical protein [Myoviridae sp. ctrCp2]